MHSDPIADMLTRIRNAQAVNKTEVILPFSKFKFNLATLLVSEGLLISADKISESSKVSFNQLKLVLKYNRSGKPVMTSIQKVSKPGRRVYTDHLKLPYVLNGLGIAVISTSKGLMTNKKARKIKMGGEIICEIY